MQQYRRSIWAVVQPSFNRFLRQLMPIGATAAHRYKKIVAHQDAIEGLFVEAFLQSQHRAPRQIVLDLDATDDPAHGHQLGRFFHGYYGHYCYLPLYH
jgi:hypothetical protein